MKLKSLCFRGKHFIDYAISLAPDCNYVTLTFTLRHYNFREVIGEMQNYICNFPPVVPTMCERWRVGVCGVCWDVWGVLGCVGYVGGVWVYGVC